MSIDERDTPSRYTPLSIRLCQTLGADAVLLFVVNGPNGTGAGSASRTPAEMFRLAKLMREWADFQEQHAHDILRRG